MGQVEWKINQVNQLNDHFEIEEEEISMEYHVQV
jgi:hypothetical protein